VKVKQCDKVFFVAVTVCVTSNNLKNEDPAKSDCFCDFYAFSKCGGANVTLF